MLNVCFLTTRLNCWFFLQLKVRVKSISLKFILCFREVRDVQFLHEKISNKSAKELFDYCQKAEQDYRHLLSGNYLASLILRCITRKPVFGASNQVGDELQKMARGLTFRI